jgi:proline iminopeptidase
MGRFVDELLQLIHFFKFKKVHLLGHSWGGTIAAYFAAHYPEYVEKLILSCPMFSAQTWIEDTNKLVKNLPDNVQAIISTASQTKNFDTKEYQEADRIFSDHYYLRDQSKKHFHDKHRHKFNRDIYLKMWGPSEFECTGTLKNYDGLDILAKISAPTLLVCGEYDTATPDRMRFIQKNYIKHAKIAVIYNAGHAAYLDNNEEYSAKISTFLE